MVSLRRPTLGFILAVIGFLGTIIICALPMWKVTEFVGANSVTALVVWDGLWMNCLMPSTGQKQCKEYDSIPALSQDLRAARALVVISIIVAALGVLLAIAGGKRTNWVEDESAKAKIGRAAGVAFMVAGVLCLIPVSWTANTVISSYNYNPLQDISEKSELGAALFIGWGASALLILGGALLCANCPPKDTNCPPKDTNCPPKDTYSAKYSAPKDYI